MWTDEVTLDWPRYKAAHRKPRKCVKITRSRLTSRFLLKIRDLTKERAENGGFTVWNTSCPSQSKKHAGFLGRLGKKKLNWNKAKCQVIKTQCVCTVIIPCEHLNCTSRLRSSRCSRIELQLLTGLLLLTCALIFFLIPAWLSFFLFLLSIKWSYSLGGILW